MPLTDIGVPRIVTMRRNGAYVGTRLELGGPFTIHHNSDAKAQSHWETIATARAQFRTMMANRDGAGLANIDPFVECTTSGNWQFPQQMLGSGPLADTRPSWLGFAQWGAAAVIGLGVAGVYYLAIDTIFEDDRAAYTKRFRTPPPSAPPRGARH